MTDSLLGRQLDEYRLEELLGKGGMARVYRGIDTRLNRHVAIKVIDTLYRSDSDYVKRFQLEAQAIGQLQHPHIVSLYRFGEAEGVIYMAMQYIEGADLGYVLRSYHADGEYIETEEALRIIREIASALDYAHSKGIIHRDIKPSNIMLARDGTAILTDFGLALLTDVGTRGEIFGSPHYLAPEQAVSSANVVPQTDLYALGVILFEMFTGTVPFDAEDPMDIAMKQMSEPPPIPSNLRPNLNPEIERVITKALAKKPEDRYQTGAELADALAEALAIADKPSFTPPDTMERKSIVERVQLELEAHPLPPLPAEVSTPGFTSTQPHAVPVPAEATIPMATQPSEIPFPVSPHAYPASDYVQPTQANTVPNSIPPSETQTITQVRRTSPMVYMGIGGGSLLVLLCIIGLIMLLASNNDDDNTSDTDGNTLIAQDATTVVPDVPPITFTPNFTLTAQSMATTTPLPPSTTPFVFPTAVTPLATIPPPTLAPTFTRPATIVPTVEGFKLVAVRHGNKAMFFKNIGTSPIPFFLIEFKDVGDDGRFTTERFDVQMLQPNECARIWRESDLTGDGEERRRKETTVMNNLRLNCELVGNQVRVQQGRVFWDNDFILYYNSNEVGTCAKDDDRCEFTFTAAQ